MGNYWLLLFIIPMIRCTNITIHNCEDVLKLNKITNTSIIELKLKDKLFINDIQMPQISNLEIINASLNSINLHQFSNVKIVNLSRNDIIDINHLFMAQNRNCTNNSIKNNNNNKITILNLSLNKISNFNLSTNKLENITSLDLTSNKIESLSSEWLKYLKSIKELILTNNKIKEIDYQILKENTKLTKLILKNNRILTIKKDAFKNSKLKYVDLSYNNVESISPESFRKMTELTELIMSGNERLNLDGRDTNLLIILDNNLNSIKMEYMNFKQFPVIATRILKYLDLSHNKISIINIGDPDGYPFLKSLKLSHNSIKFIDYDAFGRLELLENLHLDHNELIEIPFIISGALIELDLSFNNIQTILKDDLSQIRNLKSLYLQWNDIKIIQDNSFENLKFLQILNLSHNSIMTVNLNTFKGVNKLQILSLSFLQAVMNNEVSLNSFPFQEISNLRQLDLSQSPTLTALFVHDLSILQKSIKLTKLNITNSGSDSIACWLQFIIPSLENVIISQNELKCDEMNQISSQKKIKEEKLFENPPLPPHPPSSSFFKLVIRLIYDDSSLKINKNKSLRKIRDVGEHFTNDKDRTTSTSSLDVNTTIQHSYGNLQSTLIFRNGNMSTATSSPQGYFTINRKGNLIHESLYKFQHEIPSENLLFSKDSTNNTVSIGIPVASKIPVYETKPSDLESENMEFPLKNGVGENIEKETDILEKNNKKENDLKMTSDIRSTDTIKEEETANMQLNKYFISEPKLQPEVSFFDFLNDTVNNVPTITTTTTESSNPKQDSAPPPDDSQNIHIAHPGIIIFFIIISTLIFICFFTFFRRIITTKRKEKEKITLEGSTSEYDIEISSIKTEEERW